MRRALVLIALSFVATISNADARILTVGAGGQYALPSQAAFAARAGDTIAIKPGTYTDCMSINVSNVTITGTAAGVVLQNKTCENKGIITVNANNITVNGLTLQGAVSTDLNGAGIRGLGSNLTVTNTIFRNDQMGILATSPSVTNSTITIRNSTFSENGSCGSFSGGCHSIYVGRITKLDVENSRFTDEEFGHYIKSRALNSVINGNTIQDGPTAQSSYLIDIPNGGNATITNNTLEKGPNADNHCCAITMGEEKALNPAQTIIVKGNMLTNDNSHTVIFVRNDTTTPAMLSGNVFHGSVMPLTGSGTVHASPLPGVLASSSPFLGDPSLFSANVVATGETVDPTGLEGGRLLGALDTSAGGGIGPASAAISEPGTLALLGGMMTALIGFRRRAQSF